MTTRWTTAALVLASCATRPDEQAIAHLVKAELLERYSSRDDALRIIAFEWHGADAVRVRVEVNEAGRAGERVEVTCRMVREDGRHWRVAEVTR